MVITNAQTHEVALLHVTARFLLDVVVESFALICFPSFSPTLTLSIEWFHSQKFRVHFLWFCVMFGLIKYREKNLLSIWVCCCCWSSSISRYEMVFVLVASVYFWQGTIQVIVCQRRRIAKFTYSHTPNENGHCNLLQINSEYVTHTHTLWMSVGHCFDVCLLRSSYNSRV